MIHVNLILRPLIYEDANRMPNIPFKDQSITLILLRIFSLAFLHETVCVAGLVRFWM
jgi:hypothetical protein